MKIIIRKHLIRYLIISIVFATLSAMLYGCAATKPNLSIVDDNYIPPRGSETDEKCLAVKSILAEISSKNELLAIELGKLPELQNGVSMKEKWALENIFKFYNDNQSIFDETFEEMLKIGIPEIRKYCSPLQAFFWLVEDGKLEACYKILNSYYLDDLLKKAWDFQETINLSMEQLKIIINSLPQEEQRIYYDGVTKRNIANNITLLLFKHKQECFSKESKKLIKEAISRRKYHLRWGNFNVVTDRLNAPELVDYYERKRIKWCYPGGSTDHDFRYVFKYNTGHCVQITAFTVYCLRKGGYDAWEHHVPSAGRAFHAVCLFRMNGKKYIMNNGSPNQRGIIPLSESLNGVTH